LADLGRGAANIAARPANMAAQPANIGHAAGQHRGAAGEHRARLYRTAPRECPTRMGCFTLEPVARQRESRPVDTERECHMKVRTSIRSLKSRPGSVVIRRHGRVRVINRRDPRWNARQG
jgi:large subunit ribosomal protein L36